MNDFAPLFGLLFAAAAAASAYFWKKLSSAEAALKGERAAIEDQRKEAERARREVKEKRDEADELKKQLGEARNKLKKREKPEEAPKGPGKKEKAAAPAEAAPSAVAAVRISDQQLEAQHRQVVERLEAELAHSRARATELEERMARQKAEAERAAQALTAAAESKGEAAAPTTPPAGDDPETLRAQIAGLQKAAVDRERELRREVRKLNEDLGRAQRRASSNNQLYQVIKGQLDLAEDRLAAMRKKYEGAKSPEEIKREQARSRQKADAERPSPNGGHEVDNPSTIGVAEEQIVSSAPEPTPPDPPPASGLPQPAPEAVPSES